MPMLVSGEFVFLPTWQHSEAKRHLIHDTKVHLRHQRLHVRVFGANPRVDAEAMDIAFQLQAANALYPRSRDGSCHVVADIQVHVGRGR